MRKQSRLKAESKLVSGYITAAIAPIICSYCLIKRLQITIIKWPLNKDEGGVAGESIEVLTTFTTATASVARLLRSVVLS